MREVDVEEDTCTEVEDCLFAGVVNSLGLQPVDTRTEGYTYSEAPSHAVVVVLGFGGKFVVLVLILCRQRNERQHNPCKDDDVFQKA